MQIERPRYNEYTFEHALIRDSVYIEDLEGYCDYLENKVSQCGISINPCKGCTDYCYKNLDCKSNGGCGNKEIDERIKRLEKALDRACTELDLSNKQLIALDSRFIRTTKEQWKDYILNEIQHD